MNLHNLVSRYIGVVNPWLTVTLQASNGYTTSTDGMRIPAYYPAVNMLVQRQALSYNELHLLDGLNIQGVRCKLYLNGTWNSVVRSQQEGGDLITMPDGSIWLCTMVLEPWSATAGWSAIACTLQNNL